MGKPPSSFFLFLMGSNFPITWCVQGWYHIQLLWLLLTCHKHLWMRLSGKVNRWCPCYVFAALLAAATVWYELVWSVDCSGKSAAGTVAAVDCGLLVSCLFFFLVTYGYLSTVISFTCLLSHSFHLSSLFTTQKMWDTYRAVCMSLIGWKCDKT